MSTNNECNGSGDAYGEEDDDDYCSTDVPATPCPLYCYDDDQHRAQQRCFLCQRSMLGLTVRPQNLDELHVFVRERCQPTPFLHQWLLNLHEPSPVVCIACVNWKHRCSTGHLLRSRANPRRRLHNTAKKFAKPLLQIDQSILFLMQPGKYAIPDERCWQRLLDSLFDPTGVVYQRILPSNVRGILDMVLDTDVHGVVRAWWDFNNRTHFMKHPVTARLVRAMIKRDRLMVDESTGEFRVHMIPPPSIRNKPPQALQIGCSGNESDTEDTAAAAERAHTAMFTPKWQQDEEGKWMMSMPELVHVHYVPSTTSSPSSSSSYSSTPPSSPANNHENNDNNSAVMPMLIY